MAETTNTTPIETQEQRQARYRREYEARQEKALALLNDPHAFAREMWEFVFGSDYSGMGTLFMSERPRDAWGNKNEAFALIDLALDTPGSNYGLAVGLAHDMTNNLASDVQHVGVAMGVTLECLRRSMLGCWESMQDHQVHESYAAQLRELRAEIEARRKARAA